MAVTVIDAFEVVQIGDHSRKGAGGRNGMFRDMVQMGQGIAAVVQPCQRVENGGLQPRAHRVAQLVRHPLAPQDRMQAQRHFRRVETFGHQIIRPQIKGGGGKRRIRGQLHHQQPGMAGLGVGPERRDQTQGCRGGHGVFWQNQNESVGRSIGGGGANGLLRIGEGEARAQLRAELFRPIHAYRAVGMDDHTVTAGGEFRRRLRQPERAGRILAHFPFVRRVAGADKAAGPAQQQRAIERFQQHIARSRFERGEPIHGLIAIPDGQNRELRGIGSGFEHATEVRRPATRQCQRADHQIRRVFPQAGQSLFHVFGLNDVIVCRTKLDLEGDAIGRDRICNKDGPLHDNSFTVQISLMRESLPPNG